jgi:hypothetical protein
MHVAEELTPNFRCPLFASWGCLWNGNLLTSYEQVYDNVLYHSLLGLANGEGFWGHLSEMGVSRQVDVGSSPDGLKRPLASLRIGGS